MPKIRQSEEQEAMRKRWAAVDDLARECGFDDDALAHTEFCLMGFFDRVVEMCAVKAEEQSRVFTGENKEHVGAHSAALAIRTFGRNYGNDK